MKINYIKRIRKDYILMIIKFRFQRKNYTPREVQLNEYGSMECPTELLT